jgi:hypothetical protein
MEEQHMGKERFGSVQPISPEEADEGKMTMFPDAVIEAFNELISTHLVHGTATVFQDEVLALIAKKGLKKNEVFAKGWLDIEDLYGQFGWNVTYDKPGYNESYQPSFTFTKAKK